MPQTVPPRPVRFLERVKEIDMFFQGKDPVHQTMRRTARRLKNADIPYAILGGMALNAHQYRRTTADVDFLLTQQGFESFCSLHVGKNYDRVKGRPRRFVDRANGVTIDILITGRFPGTGQPGPIAFPDPAKVSEIIDKHYVVMLPTLIQLKLAARRYRDFGDVVELIRIHNLDERFLEKLDRAVHQDFIECLEEKRREDQYEAREESDL